MKIVYLSATQLPSREANSIHVMKMCQHFSRNGHTVTLLTPRKGPEAAPQEQIFEHYGVAPSFSIERLPLWLYGYGFALRAGLRARQQKPDIVYSRFLPASFVCSHLGFPVIVELHDEATNLTPIWRWMFARLIHGENLKRLVVISNPLVEYYQSVFGMDDARLLLAPDAADDPEPLPPGFRLEPANDLTVVYIGHLYAGRGIGLIGEVAKQCPWAAFHIVGGAQSDIQYWSERIGAQENVVLHGYVAPAEIDRYRLAADVLIAPYEEHVTIKGKGDTSKWMSPLKVFEYMAAGKAIVCSDLPVLHEPLTDGETALFCNPSSIEEWSAALARLRDEPQLRERLGQNARKEFLSRHTWDRRARNVLAGLETDRVRG